MEEPDIFCLYKELLYTNVLPVKAIGVPNVPTSEYISLSKLYVLAEMLMDDFTKDVVLSAMRARSKEPSSDGKTYYSDAYCVHILYNGTPEDSPARRLLVDLYTAYGDDTFGLAGDADLPKDFFFDLSVSLLSKRPSPAVQKNLQAKLRSSKKSPANANLRITSSEGTVRTLEAEKKKLGEDLTISENSLSRVRNSKDTAETVVWKLVREVIDLKVKLEGMRPPPPRHLQS